MAKKKSTKLVKLEYPKVIETFSDVAWQLSRVEGKEPTSFNGVVRFRKFRIIIDMIEEPVEILQERLEKLWVECDNWHQWTPLQDAATSIGYKFKGEWGSKRKP